MDQQYLESKLQSTTSNNENPDKADERGLSDLVPIPSETIDQSEVPVNSIFGPEGLLAKYSESTPAPSSVSTVPSTSKVEGHPLDGKEAEGPTEKFRLLKKRKLFPGPHHRRHIQKSSSIPNPSAASASKSLPRAASLQSQSTSMDIETGPEPGADPESERNLNDLIEKAFGIELIVKKIFTLLETSTLKTVRFVSPYWAQLGAKQLQKRMKISFHFRLQNSEHDYWSPENQQSLKSLCQLLENKSGLRSPGSSVTAMDTMDSSETGAGADAVASNSDSNSAPPSSSFNFEFPCNSFEFYPAILNQDTFQNFLYFHGTEIKKLKLYLNYFSEDSYSCSSLGHLETLLVDQVPFLRELELRMDISDEIEDDTKNKPFLIQNCSQNKNQLPEMEIPENNIFETNFSEKGQSPQNRFSENIFFGKHFSKRDQYCKNTVSENHSTEEAKHSKNTLVEKEMSEHKHQSKTEKFETATGSLETEPISLPNLAVLKMWDGVHLGIFEGIVNSARNLQEVCLDTENLHYLFEPKNRLHLLKKLTLDLDYDNVDSMEIIASHENLRLRKLIFHLNHQHTLRKHWPRVTSALNKILRSSALTLEKITWGPVGVLQGIQIPQMPQLRKLTMEIEDLGVDFEMGRNEYFFPSGFKVSEMFPKLSSIFMLNGWMIAKYGFSSYFNSNEVMGSLRYFRINHMSRNRIAEQEMEWFGRTFPHAQLLFWPSS